MLSVAVRGAARVRAEEPEAEHAFALALGTLRAALVTHNADEQALLEPLLAGQDRAGVLRHLRLLEEHAAEHDLFEHLLDRTLTSVAAHMDELAADLDAHMLAEERTFLSPIVFRDASPPP